MQSEQAGFLTQTRFMHYLKLYMGWLQIIILLGILGGLCLHLKLIWNHILDFGGQEGGALLLRRLF